MGKLSCLEMLRLYVHVSNECWHIQIEYKFASHRMEFAESEEQEYSSKVSWNGSVRSL